MIGPVLRRSVIYTAESAGPIHPRQTGRRWDNGQPHCTTRDPMSEGTLLIEHEVEVRWRDLDAYNHVNNASFLTFLEEARVRWFGTLPGPWRGPDGEPVLARIETSFKRSIGHPSTVVVRLHAVRAGNTSLVLGHRIEDRRSGEVCADGLTVLVWVSPEDGRPVPLPAMVRRAVAGESMA